MNLLVDGSNLGSGGALTQIHHFLDYCENDARIKKLIVLTHQSNDIKIQNFTNLHKCTLIRNNDRKIFFKTPFSFLQASAFEAKIDVVCTERFGWMLTNPCSSSTPRWHLKRGKVLPKSLREN